MLAVGHSEGGIVAAGVAARLRAVSHVAVLAGGGPTQLFDMVELMGRDEAMRQWAEIQKDPLSIDKFAWGHPYRRWSTFLATSPLEELLRSRAKVFIAQGTTDKNSPAQSADLLEAGLRAKGREVTMDRIENAGHDFLPPGETQPNGFRTVFKQVVDWWLGRVEETR